MSDYRSDVALLKFMFFFVDVRRGKLDVQKAEQKHGLHNSGTLEGLIEMR